VKQNNIHIIHDAINKVCLEYENDPNIIFYDEPRRRSKLYYSVSRKIKSWNRQKQCIYRGCTNRSIRQSHSIQKLGALKEISSNSHVLTPRFNQEEGVVKLVKIGLSKASTFPGFCNKHENLFSIFENNIENNFSCSNELAMQIYRSICREIVRLRHDIHHGNIVNSEFQEFRDKELEKLIYRKLGTRWVKKNSAHNLNLKYREDPSLNRYASHILSLTCLLNEMENEYLKELEDDIAGAGNNSLQPIIMSIDEKIPISLSGMGSFHVVENGSLKQISVVLIVLPNASGTTIVIHGKAVDTGYYHAYIKRLDNSFDLLNMVEQWMIRGTDHWFIGSDVWEAKNENNRTRILEEILDGTKGLLHELSFSVFDDLRKRMIYTWESEGFLDGKQRKIIAREKSKLL